MCLIAQANVKPCVAQKDIKVVKLLKKQEDGSYVTPFQDTPVTLNSMLRAGGNSKGFICGYNDCREEITSGFIHASLSVGKYDIEDCVVGMVAYIPMGTEYFVGIYVSDVCAKQLFITDEVVDLKTFSLTKEEMTDVIKPFIEQLIPSNEVTPGWLFTTDRQFVHPLGCKEEVNIIGVVATTDDNGNPSTAFALDEAHLDWGRGVEHCKTYKTNSTKDGEWALPDKEVLLNALEKHIAQINLALAAIGRELLNGDVYWASAEYSSTNAWNCNTNNANLNNNNKWNSNYVRPSFAN